MQVALKLYGLIGAPARVPKRNPGPGEETHYESAAMSADVSVAVWMAGTL